MSKYFVSCKSQNGYCDCFITIKSKRLNEEAIYEIRKEAEALFNTELIILNIIKLKK